MAYGGGRMTSQRPPRPVTRGLPGALSGLQRVGLRLTHASLAATLAAAWSLTGCFAGAEPQDHAVEVYLAGPPPEEIRNGFLQESDKTLYERLEALRQLASSPHEKGLLLRVGALGGAFARARELSRALARIRATGKPVHCHFESTDNAGFALLAHGCDRISMAPPGILDLSGVRAQAFYARDLLDKVGVSAELLHAGRYKGAADSLTRSTMPEHTRTTLTNVVQTLQGTVINMVAGGRSLTKAQVKAAMAQAPLRASTARSLKLVDDLGYLDEAREHLRQAAQVDRVIQVDGEDTGGGLLGLFESLDDSELLDGSKHVVLVPIVGTIGEPSSALEEGLSPRRFVKEMRRIADDPEVAALVLRIDSPGGSAVASDLMWHAVYQVAKKKPVYASVGDMAASGGYYIASAARKIHAEPTSLLGSIGVVGGKIALADLAEKLGVHVETVRTLPNAGWSSPVSRFSDSERKAVAEMLQATYDLFLRRVSLGRDKSRKELEPYAEGRVFDAATALKGGLIDDTAGLLETLDAARKAAGLPHDSTVVVWPGRRSPLDTLLNATQARAQPPSVQQISGHPWSGPLSPVGILLRELPALQVLAGSDQVAATLPFGLQIR